MNFAHQSAIADAISSGYVKNPNQIYNVRGAQYYPGSPGLPVLADGLVFIDGGMDIFKPGMPKNNWSIVRYAHVYGKGCTLSPIARYETWSDFLEYLNRQRITSAPGMPAGIFGD